jgi:hypothetical protein
MDCARLELIVFPPMTASWYTLLVVAEVEQPRVQRRGFNRCLALGRACKQ